LSVPPTSGSHPSGPESAYVTVVLKPFPP
jgi:hypothetical protein